MLTVPQLAIAAPWGTVDLPTVPTLDFCKSQCRSRESQKNARSYTYKMTTRTRETVDGKDEWFQSSDNTEDRTPGANFWPSNGANVLQEAGQSLAIGAGIGLTFLGASQPWLPQAQ